MKKIQLLFIAIFSILSIYLIFSVIINPQTVFATEDITETWFELESLPTHLASHVSLSHGSMLYILGGATLDDTSIIRTAIQGANGSLSSWSSLQSLPRERYWAAGVKYNNYVYLLGGSQFSSGTTSYFDDVYFSKIQPDGTFSPWTLTAPLPNNLSQGQAVIVNNRIYFSGGFNTNGKSNKVYMAPLNDDGTLGSWGEVESLPTTLVGHGMIEHNNNIYVLGGENSKLIFRTMVNPDGTLSAWQQISQFPEVVNRSGMIKVGDMIISVGGANTTQAFDRVYYTKINEDGSLEPWEASSHTLPAPVHTGAIAKIGNYLYLTGGYGTNYIDTVYATKLNISTEPNLAVPLLKQTDPAWGSQLYDSANIWSSGKTGIDRWGCALTSAVMVFNYHGISKLPNGQTLNPGNLNAWLKSQSDGYVGTGWVNWIVLSRLSKIAKPQNPEFSYNGLEFSQVSGFASEQLVSDLENNIPGILEVPGHFIVGKGLENGEVVINDPYYSRTSLAEYNSTFMNLNRFVPSNTDLSYMMLTVSEGVTLSVKDKNGDIVGEGFLQQALVDDIGGGKNSPLYIYYVPKPQTGEFTIEVSSTARKQYELKQYLYDADGEVKIITTQGIINNNNSDSYETSYEKEDISRSDSSQKVTFASFLADLDSYYALDEIKNLGIYITLKQNTQLANEFSRNNKAAARAHMKTVVKLLDHSKRNFLSENAYKVLKPQAEELYNSL